MDVATNSKAIRDYLIDLQKTITTTLTQVDGQSFLCDKWHRPSDASLQGDGCSMVLENSIHLERAGVNFSHVSGNTLPSAASAQRPEIAGAPFEAMGISLVLHPRNPYVPTVHMNVRFFLTKNKQDEAVWWFGGGMDLTPYYGNHEDCRHFHKTCQSALTPFGPTLYPRFKKACDDYFYLKHRQEARGIGGIFYDDFCELGFEQSFAMTRAVGDALLKAYLPILQIRKDTPYTEAQRQFQSYRRGRYVEFNLVFDRGTLFGLQSGGRTESILMSMPPSARWDYNWQATPGSAEAQLYTDFLPHQDWVV
ncbi:MAG: oxygen-dependent coproporphyrinogen oxidase [Ottowia sp.]|nr:oxygen-dependent coproporphyrinogen oxidase [Ottowia sp.]